MAALIFIVLAFVISIMYSGFNQEDVKIRSMIFSVTACWLLLAFLLQPAFFILGAIYDVYVKGRNRDARVANKEKNIRIMNLYKVNRIPLDLYDINDYLLNKIKNIKALLHIDHRHRKEIINSMYRHASSDVVVYGVYSLLIIGLGLGMHQEADFHDYRSKKTIFAENRLSNVSLNALTSEDGIYDYIKANLIEALLEGKDYRNLKIQEPGWMHFHIGKLIGLVQLRQLRIIERTDSEDRGDYMPDWKLPFKSINYFDDYSPVYSPWIYDHGKGLTLQRKGQLFFYKDNTGFKAFLGRDVDSSTKMLEFLQKNHWIDHRSSMIFMDFVLYNQDIQTFTFVTITIERTKFGSSKIRSEVESQRLFVNLSNLNFVGFIIIIFFVFMLTSVIKNVLDQIVHVSDFFSSLFNWIDVIILVLNFVVVFLFYKREKMIKIFLHLVETTHKVEFIQFFSIKAYTFFMLLTLSLLVFLTFIRILKVLRFWRIFKIFGLTFKGVYKYLVGFLLYLLLFIYLMTVFMVLVNPESTYDFKNLIMSFQTILAFALSFDPIDGDRIKVILDFLSMVCLLLMLLFLIVIFESYSNALIIAEFYTQRSIQNKLQKYNITFFEFLKKEHKHKFRKFQICPHLHINTQEDFSSKYDEAYAEEAELQVEKELLILPTLRDIAEIEETHRDIIQKTKRVSYIIVLQCKVISDHLKNVNIAFDTNELAAQMFNSLNKVNTPTKDKCFLSKLRKSKDNSAFRASRQIPSRPSKLLYDNLPQVKEPGTDNVSSSSQNFDKPKSRKSKNLCKPFRTRPLVSVPSPGPIDIAPSKIIEDILDSSKTSISQSLGSLSKFKPSEPSEPSEPTEPKDPSKSKPPLQESEKSRTYSKRRETIVDIILRELPKLRPQMSDSISVTESFFSSSSVASSSSSKHVEEIPKTDSKISTKKEATTSSLSSLKNTKNSKNKAFKDSDSSAPSVKPNKNKSRKSFKETSIEVTTSATSYSSNKPSRSKNQKEQKEQTAQNFLKKRKIKNTSTEFTTSTASLSSNKPSPSKKTQQTSQNSFPKKKNKALAKTCKQSEESDSISSSTTTSKTLSTTTSSLENTSSTASSLLSTTSSDTSSSQEPTKRNQKARSKQKKQFPRKLDP